MIIAPLILFFAAATINVDVVTIPLTDDIKVVLAPSARGSRGRAELKHEGSLSQVKIEIDYLPPPSSLGVFNTYVVWAVSSGGILDNLGEVQVNGNKGQINATTRFGQFGILITAEPHYMVDRPSSAVAFQSEIAKTDVHRKTVAIDVGSYDYSALQPPNALGVQKWVVQARAAFQIAKSAGADRLASEEFRNAQVAIGSLEELVSRAAPADILWPTANDAIGWSQRAVAVARTKKE